TLDVPAMTVGGSTMVPLRFIGESLGANVQWDAPNRTVMIETEGAPVIAERPDFGDFRTRPRPHRDIPEVEPNPIPEAPLTVTSISHNLRDGWIRPGQTLTVTLRGTPGAQAFF